MKATLKTLHEILDKAAQAGCKISCDLPRTKKGMRGSRYIEISKEETDDCFEVNVTVRFSDHERRLSAILNHSAPTIETTCYDTTYVCKRLNEELSFLWA
jgi:hypothetical protein